jgi:hypothetical protein
MHFWRRPKLGERPGAEAEAARVQGATEGQRAVPDAAGKRRHGDQIAEDVEVRQAVDTSALAALFGSQVQLPEGGSPRLREAEIQARAGINAGRVAITQSNNAAWTRACGEGEVDGQRNEDRATEERADEATHIRARAQPGYSAGQHVSEDG